MTSESTRFFGQPSVRMYRVKGLPDLRALELVAAPSERDLRAVRVADREPAVLIQGHRRDAPERAVGRRPFEYPQGRASLLDEVERHPELRVVVAPPGLRVGILPRDDGVERAPIPEGDLLRDVHPCGRGIHG